MSPTVQVSAYNPEWPARFQALKERIWPWVAEHALSIEHVGSTSVPGLAAKDIIDLDVVVLGADKLQACIQALCAQGYVYEGERGIAGRHAFSGGQEPAHHLYVCLLGTLGLRNHLAVRDFLRLHPLRAQAYGALKLELAKEHSSAPAKYGAGKTAYLVDLLRELGFDEATLAEITSSNAE